LFSFAKISFFADYLQLFGIYCPVSEKIEQQNKGTIRRKPDAGNKSARIQNKNGFDSLNLPGTDY